MKVRMKITQWRLMVAKLKAKFISSNYGRELFKKVQNLKQKEMTVKGVLQINYSVLVG